MEEEYTTNDVVELIKFMKNATPEEIRMIYFDALKIYIMSLYKFGKDNFVTKDCLNIAKEFRKICKKEKEIFKYIIQNIDNIDVDRTLEYLEMLDELNERTYLYYDRVIADIEYALEVNEPNRGKRIRKNFEMLTDTDKYEEELNSLVLK